MAETSLPTVLAAVRALYGLEGPGRQREANEFLIEFARTEAAWSIGLQLLCDASLDASTETLFFAANMIHAKARKEWMRLADNNKTAMVAMLQSLLGDARTGQRPQLQATPVQTKLCGLLAVAMCSAPDDCRALLHTLVDGSAAMDPAALAFFLTFARCVIEELDEAELSFAAKDAMEVHVATLCSDVVGVLSSILLGASASTTVQGEALLCLRVWMKRAGLSLSRMHRDHRDLLTALLASLGQRSVHMDRSADILCQVFNVAEYPAASLQDEALQATARNLLSLRAAYASAVAAEEEEIAHSITTVATTFGELYVDWIVEGEVPEAVALGEWMLTLTGHPKRQIAALTLEFWLIVQEIPVVERHVFFQRQAYEQLLDVLLRQCAYPDEADEADEFLLDDLLAFRSAAADVLLAVLALLQHDCLTRVLSHVSSSWPSVEVALFVVSTVAPDLKRRLLPQSPMEHSVSQVLQLLFSRSNSHALVVTSGARLLGQLAAWFAAQSLDTVVAVLQYLDQALHVSASCDNAARSLMQVLTACAPSLADLPPAFVTDSVVPHLQQLSLDQKLVIVEGITRLAARSRHAPQIVRAVLDGAIGRLVAACSASARDEAAAATVASDELLVCGRLLRFLDAPSAEAGGLALTRLAVESLWPALPSVATRFAAVEKVMDALFQVYGWSLQSLREDAAASSELLPPVASLVATVFESQRIVAPLECAAVAVDVAGRRPQCVPLFQQLLAAVAATALRHFQERGVGESPDVLRALFELAYRCLLYCPEALLAGGTTLRGLLTLARACVGLQHRHATNAVLTFVAYLLQESRGKLQGFQTVIDSMVWVDAAELNQWLDAALQALLVTTPSVLLDAMARLWQALWVPAFDQYAQVIASLASQRLAAQTQTQTLTEAEARRVVELWFQYAQTPTKLHERQFRSLCADVARICRKELTPDALLGYDDNSR